MSKFVCPTALARWRMARLCTCISLFSSQKQKRIQILYHSGLIKNCTHCPKVEALSHHNAQKHNSFSSHSFRLERPNTYRRLAVFAREFNEGNEAHRARDRPVLKQIHRLDELLSALAPFAHPEGGFRGIEACIAMNHLHRLRLQRKVTAAFPLFASP